MSDFYSKVYLTQSEQFYHVKQLTSHDFMQLQKYLMENDDDTIAEFLDFLLCTYVRGETATISNLDRLALLIKLRSISCGGIIRFANSSGAQASLSLSDVSNKIDAIKRFSTCNLKVNEFDIHVSLPSSIYFKDNTELLIGMIREIEILGKNINWGDLNALEKRKVFYNLPTHVFSVLCKWYSENDQIVEIFTGNRELGFNSISISPFSNSLIEFLKFIFTDDLLNQYKSTYMLCSKVGLDAQFVSNISPIEQQLFIKFYADEIDEQNKQLKSKQAGINLNHG